MFAGLLLVVVFSTKSNKVFYDFRVRACVLDFRCNAYTSITTRNTKPVPNAFGGVEDNDELKSSIMSSLYWLEA